jgi:hypothetical protein
MCRGVTNSKSPIDLDGHARRGDRAKGRNGVITANKKMLGAEGQGVDAPMKSSSIPAPAAKMGSERDLRAGCIFL